ncbi:MAG: Na/Pi cotransporter family protein [Lachnospiraceae bacterium]|nr:Na/Pi cotransporter family protein [Lachnospiraceae bacterium]
MNDTLRIITTMLGGLAVFIYGMNLMSEGLQKAAGEKMRYILGILTKNPIVGVLAGALITAVLQSSSATTVMTLGFASAGLMSLPQAISVILGANIGTTLTAQIIAFKIDEYIWLIVLIGFLFYFFSKGEQMKNVGQSLFGFGILFVGITTMGNVMKPLAGSAVFIQLMERVSHIPVLGILMGTVMTIIVQSSSATIAVLQNFAMQPAADGISSILGLENAIPILLGDNIGTTITALFACIGQSKNARRTAAAHSVFNISGSFLFIWIVPWFAKIVRFLSPGGSEVEVISRQIANAHTIFNVCNTLLWLPFIWLMVRIVMFFVPGEDEKENANIRQFLDMNMLNQPIAAMQLIGREIINVSEDVKQILDYLEKAIVNHDISALGNARKAGESIKEIQKEMVDYMSHLFSNGVLTEEQSVQAAGLMSVISDVERMGLRSMEMAEAAQVKVEKGYQFSKEAMKEIKEGFEQIRAMVTNVVCSLQKGDKELAKQVMGQKEEVTRLVRRQLKNHVKRLKKGNCSPEFTFSFTEILYSMERISIHCMNIADAVLEDFQFSCPAWEFMLK